MRQDDPPLCPKSSRNGCDSTSDAPTKSSATSSRTSSSDSKPCPLPVDAITSSPGRCRCFARQVNPRIGRDDSTGT